MKHLYIDDNFVICCMENKELFDEVMNLKESQIQCIYSPAHMETIYRQLKKSPNYAKTSNQLLDAISKITNNKEALPNQSTKSAIVITVENPTKCFKRVSDMDTTDKVAVDAEEKDEIDRLFYKDKMKNKKYTNISNKSAEDIWKWKEVKELVEHLNQNIDKIIQNNNSDFSNTILYLAGINKFLPEDFIFSNSRYEILKKEHTQLEFTIEILFRVLNYCGYNSEEKGNEVSSIHDVSHAIYGTCADYIITSDLRFSKKCKAVYSFIGAPTKVIFSKQCDFLDVIIKLKQGQY